MVDKLSILDSPIARIVQSMNAIRAELGIQPTTKEYAEDSLVSLPMSDLLQDLSRELYQMRQQLADTTEELVRAKQEIDIHKLTIADMAERRERELRTHER